MMRIAYFLFFMWVPVGTALSQCDYIKISHLSGTQTVGCVDVTVTSDSPAFFSLACGYSPYGIGLTGDGSFTFSFSPAVPEVKVALAVLNGGPGGTEELSFEVNGVFYPVTQPGQDDGCYSPAILSGTGTIIKGPGAGNASSWSDVIIDGPINTLKIQNTWLSGSPNGVVVEVHLCCPGCETDAGEISSADTVLCTNETLDITSTGSDLEPDDALEYILFSDLSDTLGSIVLTSSSPSFSFSDPPLQTGVTYYVAAIAGNELPGGGVDVTDPCLDISNVISVVWNPLPTVEFAVANPDVCQGGCTDVVVTLTGTPPFTLTYDTPGNTGQTASFPGLTGTLQVCVPGNTAPGSFSLQAVSLADGNCTCN
ncbi:MAG: hypothetical protein H6577_15700 [Lewinellaceae bacterium]|nr:hypothetical protein [Lewinellaceae bacterium]